jgi:hypothetical protein
MAMTFPQDRHVDLYDPAIYTHSMFLTNREYESVEGWFRDPEDASYEFYEWCVSTLGYYPIVTHDYLSPARRLRASGVKSTCGNFKSEEDAILFRLKWL